MSNKKQQQYIVKSSGSSENSANSVPPRYQPPPLPPGNQSNQGILKHPPPPKDGTLKQGPPLKHPQDNLKNTQYYPMPTGILPPNTSKQFPGYLYPPGAIRPPLLRQQPQQQPNQRPYEDEVLRQPPIPDEANLIVPRHPQQPQQQQPPPQQLRFSDEELLRLPQAEMLKFVRKSENETSRLNAEHSRHMQGLIGDLRALKEANQRLGDDNQELRDLCCFLDDDRQKGRKLAREWQRFGRYTASVMRQEVSAYQSKLRELDNKQQELIKDNLELKELCLYLDEERGNSVCPSCGTATNLRDDGDGSSSSTNADEPAVQFNSPGTPRRSASRERLLHENLARQRNTLNDQTMQYVRSLEQRVKQLEDEKRTLAVELSKVSGESLPTDTGPAVLTGRPEAVVRALQVLEVREQLERDGRLVSDVETPDMDDGEKALVREMCNVVWRKLEEGPPARR